MPWSEKTPVSERRRFIDEFLRGSGTMSDLCASYGLTPKRSAAAHHLIDAASERSEQGRFR